MAPRLCDFSQRDEKMVALVVADYFDNRFKPLIASSSLGVVKIANIEILNITLEWISRTEIIDVILAVSNERSHTIQQIVNYWKVRFKSLLCISCPACTSVGDAVREVYSRSLLKGDFLLISNPATFCSSNLKDEISRFRSRRKKDRRNVMTLLFCDSKDINPTVAYSSDSQKLITFQNETSKRFPVSKDAFVFETIVRKDIKDTGIAICALNVASQFSDNFDYEHRDDIVKELLGKEEILNQSINIEIFPHHVTAISILDYDDLLTANSFIILRSFGSIFPGLIAGQPFLSFYDNYLSVEKNVVWHATVDEKRMLEVGFNLVIGRNCKVGDNTSIINCSIGDNTRIGADCDILSCIIGRNVKIGHNVQLEQVIIGDDVSIGNNVNVGVECLLANKVSIPNDSTIQSGTFICDSDYANEEEDHLECINNEFGKVLKMKKGGDSLWRKIESEGSSTPGEEMGLSDEEDLEDSSESAMFFEEVKESMRRIDEEDCDNQQFVRTLIIEINSSKLAYNISMEIVAYYVFRSFLTLERTSSVESMKELANKWKHLFLNYYQPTENQIQALQAMEDHLKLTPSFKSLAATTVHTFYLLDVLEEDSILSWYSESDEITPLRVLLERIINWLKEADEDEDD